jgi:hypothetical protein
VFFVCDGGASNLSVPVLRLPLTRENDLTLCRAETRDTSLGKLDRYAAQHLRQEAPVDDVIGSKLKHARALGDGVSCIHQRDLDLLAGNFAGHAHGTEQVGIPPRSQACVLTLVSPVQCCDAQKQELLIETEEQSKQW